MKSLKLGRPFRDFFSLSLIFIQFKNNNNNNHILFFNKRAIIFQKKKKKCYSKLLQKPLHKSCWDNQHPKKRISKACKRNAPRAAQCSVQNRIAEIAPALLPIYNYNFPFDSSNNRLSRPFFYLFFFFSFSKIVTIYC